MSTPDRFDLEQSILGCWNIVDDLKMIVQYHQRQQQPIDPHAIDALIHLYQIKFEQTFSTFETVIVEAHKRNTVTFNDLYDKQSTDN